MMAVADEADAKAKRKNEPKHHYSLRDAVRLPWWFLGLAVLWLLVITSIINDPKFSRIYDELQEGIGLTLYLAFMGYIIAVIIGLVVGLIRAYPPKTPDKGAGWRRYLQSAAHTVIYNVATFYVELIRGIPAVVLLLLAGFVVVPALRDVINQQFIPALRTLLNNPELPEIIWRAADPATAITGLGLIYGAFLAEVFRAGIQSVPKGQVEAARSLGMTYPQTLRFIVIPQAIRTVLPPLGNDFIAMIKDTSLVTILGTNEITQLARKWVGSSFQYAETYLVLSLIYLTLTVTGSVLVQIMERRLKRHERR